MFPDISNMPKMDVNGLNIVVVYVAIFKQVRRKISNVITMFPCPIFTNTEYCSELFSFKRCSMYYTLCCLWYLMLVKVNLKVGHGKDLCNLHLLLSDDVRLTMFAWFKATACQS